MSDEKFRDKCFAGSINNVVLKKNTFTLNLCHVTSFTSKKLLDLLIREDQKKVFTLNLRDGKKGYNSAACQNVKNCFLPVKCNRLWTLGL